MTATVPDVTDLAATLRRRSANTLAGFALVTPEEAERIATALEHAAALESGLLVETLRRDYDRAIAAMPDIMAKLERGAAAEAVVAAVKLFNDYDEDDDTPYEATHLALAAYDALTEGKPTDG